jgi:hypothetical protein
MKARQKLKLCTKRERRVIIKPRRTGNGGARYREGGCGLAQLLTLVVHLTKNLCAPYTTDLKADFDFALHDKIPEGNSLRRMEVALEVYRAAGLVPPL